MQRALFIWALIIPSFAKILHPDVLRLEALNEELEYVTNRLDAFISNQGDWDEGGLDLPTKDVTWRSLTTNFENLINQTVQLHISKLEAKILEVNSNNTNALEEIESLKQDYLNRLSKELGNKVHECPEKEVSWNENLIEAKKNVKFASDYVNNLKSVLIAMQNNISQQEDDTTNIRIELKKLISDSESTSKEQADINAAILKLEKKQEQLMEKMGIEMMRQLKEGNEEIKKENNFIKSFLDQLMEKIVELKDFEKNFNRKVEGLLEKLNSLKREEDATKVEYGSTREAIEQLRKEVSQQREDIFLLRQSSAADDELQQVRDAMDAIRASASSRPDVAAVHAKIVEARRTCVTGDDVQRLLQASKDSKCSARVKHTPGRPSRLQIEIVSSGKRKT